MLINFYHLIGENVLHRSYCNPNPIIILNNGINIIVGLVSGIQWIGELVSTVQISLTYLLLMVVSTGYGINR